MLVQPIQENSQSAHVVVLGNEKGGSGKSTTALHIAVALLKAGQRVATVDLDCRPILASPAKVTTPRWCARRVAGWSTAASLIGS
jgi:Mrp family chromosome partitioning ATPase